MSHERMGRRRVGIVGGGASGALVAARLLADAQEPVEVLVFEPRERLAEGVAYGTDDPRHLLNVPACGMSALPDDPDHFRRWARAADTDFVPRSRYAEYLRDVLATALAGAPAGSGLTHVAEPVTNLGLSPEPWVVTCQGTFAALDALVLATGHGAPAVPAALDDARLPDVRLVRDPWRPGALDVVERGETVLLVGTGLTAVDVAVSLASSVRGVRIEAVSRHGLLPAAHEDPWRPRHPAPEWAPGSVRPRDVLAYVRSFGEDWRRGLDSLRAITPDVWRGFSSADRASLVRHLERYWDVHRHRMAPGVAAVVDRLIRAGRLRVSAGAVESAALTSGRIEVLLSGGRSIEVDRIVMCTGPTGQVSRDPIGRLLLARGQVQAAEFDRGYLVDPLTGAVIDGDGAAIADVYAVGPLRRGVLFESTAMPEIRVQAAQIAQSILQRQPAQV